MEEQKEKRVLRVELNDDVKRVSITGTDSDEKVVMRQDLGEEELDMATGGGGGGWPCLVDCPEYTPPIIRLCQFYER